MKRLLICTMTELQASAVRDKLGATTTEATYVRDVHQVQGLDGTGHVAILDGSTSMRRDYKELMEMLWACRIKYLSINN